MDLNSRRSMLDVACFMWEDFANGCAVVVVFPGVGIGEGQGQ